MKNLLKLSAGLVLMMISSVLFAQPVGCHYHQSDLQIQEPDPVSRAKMRAAVERSDSIDILHYEIWLDVTKFSGTLKGQTTVTLTPKLPDQD